MADPTAPPPAYPPAQPDPAYPQPAAAYPPPQPQPVADAYPPPQPQPAAAYPPPQPQAATTVVVTQQPVVQQPVVFRDRPVVVIDSNGQQVTTQLQFKSGLLTWLVCCALCWITGLICIAPIPFCIDALKDVYHITPTDGKVVGVYKRIG